MSATIVSSGQVSSRAAVNSNDTLVAVAGGAIISPAVNGGTIVVSSGGVLSGYCVTLIADGSPTGSIVISSGGKAENLYTQGEPSLLVTSGGSISGTHFGFGPFEVYGTATSSVVADTVTQIIEAGGVDSGSIIVDGGAEIVRAGGHAVGTVVSSGGGLLVENPDAIVTSANVLNGGALILEFLPYASGGSATLDASGLVTVSEGGQSYRLQLAAAPGEDVATRAAVSGTAVVFADARVAYTDTVTQASGLDVASAYTGPVNYLDQQYIWSGADNVALSAVTSSVFLAGGAGSDALQVSGGNNVLDGGSGSNFLVGASGSDGGHDTFFVDTYGGGPVWSTIVNFHAGDAVTLWGFHPGISTQVVATSDGTAGYTGYTIHSELNGAGTGVNASLTLAGISQATVAAHITILAGTLNAGTSSAQDCLYLTWNK